ncbi:DUF1028 domain-containing protein [Marivirga sp.]|uniref:DUF1028 domain-containing protein n=1 Tax=Marivirga sp. TaxID=2018662 RepID=UPI0025F366B5|nr:DUF1028 domain-containing protein [Marivirga sp.]
MKNIYVLILCFAFSFEAISQLNRPNDPLTHTYSIVARDAETGEMAVAVQSHWFSVGTAVSWGEAGVGVVATQSFTNKSFGLRGLAMLKAGLSPQEALDSLLNNDDGKAFRQVAILDSKGRVATHTGAKCIDEAGHANGDNFSVQANMMLNDTVVPEMEKAWKKFSDLPLAERMVKVLEAAQTQGGDIRGKQSAALLVVKAEATDEPWNDRLLDLRVDDHESPVQELNRLVKVYRAYEHMNQGDYFVEKGQMQEAMNEYNAAMEMFPKNLEMQYWTAITLANDGKIEKATEMLQKIYKQDANWRELTKRLPKVGLLEVEDRELQKLLK